MGRLDSTTTMAKIMAEGEGKEDEEFVKILVKQISEFNLREMHALVAAVNVCVEKYHVLPPNVVASLHDYARLKQLLENGINKK